MNLQTLSEALRLPVKSLQSVHGGDINDAYCLQTKKEKFFLKVNSRKRFTKMFRKEANGLQALKENFSLTVPATLQCIEADDKQLLLQEWLEKGTPRKDFWESFGTAVANMHKQPQPYFGWHENNYIGSIIQQNDRRNSWQEFYAETRIMPLVQQLYHHNGIARKQINQAENLYKEIDNIFPGEPPSLLHGDLWSGNFCVAQNGYAAIFDPAVYYGHREMDIGMTKLFGGFHSAFYEAYNATYPLGTGWQQRLQLTQLYPLLVHAILFGGHYISSVKNILLKF